jgi:hypothetical protein
MKTYLTLFFSTNGTKPSEVTKLLERMGFEATHGPYDFVYDWKSDSIVEDVVEFADRVKVLLESHNVVFKMETV